MKKALLVLMTTLTLAAALVSQNAYAAKRAIWVCEKIGGNTGWTCNIVGYEEY